MLLKEQQTIRLSDEFCWDDEDQALIIFDMPEEEYKLSELYSSAYTYEVHDGRI